MTKKEVMKLKKGDVVLHKGMPVYFYSFNGITTWCDRFPSEIKQFSVAFDYKQLEHPTELLKALL